MTIILVILEVFRTERITIGEWDGQRIADLFATIQTLLMDDQKKMDKLHFYCKYKINVIKFVVNKALNLFSILP